MTGHGCGKALVARHRVTSYANSIKLSHPPPLTWASRSRTAAADGQPSRPGPAQAARVWGLAPAVITERVGRTDSQTGAVVPVC
jgi:hypothetical protein